MYILYNLNVYVILEVGVMFMLETAVKAADFRANFSSVVDEVIHKAPKIVTRTRDQFIMMNIEQAAILVSNVTFNAVLETDNDGSFIATLLEIEDMFAAGENSDNAIIALANDLIEYAEDYLHESFVLYFNALNRKKHFPYVLKVMMQNSVEDVIKLIHVQP